LQSATSHYLGDNFAKSINFKIQNEKNDFFYPFQTSWGTSTRLIGGIIMTHSDDNGLVLPSKIAPFQIVIIKITDKKNDNDLNSFIKKLYLKLRNKFRVKIDDSNQSFGYRIKN
jgi:prolyl-tRNA synthetase